MGFFAVSIQRCNPFPRCKTAILKVNLVKIESRYDLDSASTSLNISQSLPLKAKEKAKKKTRNFFAEYFFKFDKFSIVNVG